MPAANQNWDWTQQQEPKQESESVERLTRDLANAAKTLSDDEARFLVDAYYMMQDDRKRAANQVRALGEAKEPNAVLSWFAKQSETLEGQIKRALDRYTEAHPMGSWMRQIVGIGPVISAGMLAHIDLTPFVCAHVHEPDIEHGKVNPYYNPKAKPCRENEPHGPECARQRLETAGHIWSFAGLAPGVVWEKGQRRPWNAKLKTLCWKAGQSFMKFSGRDDCFYGRIYVQRKQYEVLRNDRGGNAELAALKVDKVSKGTDAYPWLAGCYPPGTLAEMLTYDAEKRPTFLAQRRGKVGQYPGMLAPGNIDARARRYAVKLFLAHLHGAWYEQRFNAKPPLPYPIAYLGHVHVIESPVPAPKPLGPKGP